MFSLVWIHSLQHSYYTGVDHLISSQGLIRRETLQVYTAWATYSVFVFCCTFTSHKVVIIELNKICQFRDGHVVQMKQYPRSGKATWGTAIPAQVFVIKLNHVDLFIVKRQVKEKTSVGNLTIRRKRNKIVLRPMWTFSERKMYIPLYGRKPKLGSVGKLPLDKKRISWWWLGKQRKVKDTYEVGVTV